MRIPRRLGNLRNRPDPDRDLLYPGGSGPCLVAARALAWDFTEIPPPIPAALAHRFRNAQALAAIRRKIILKQTVRKRRHYYRVP